MIYQRLPNIFDLCKIGRLFIRCVFLKYKHNYQKKKKKRKKTNLNKHKNIQKKNVYSYIFKTFFVARVHCETFKKIAVLLKHFNPNLFGYLIECTPTTISTGKIESGR